VSRAFVKEADGEAAEGDLPERPVSPHPNYVTPRGLERLREQHEALEQARRALKDDESLRARQERAELERDLRYVSARIANAQLVAPDPAATRVRIGCQVDVVDEHGRIARYAIVGEDEADAAQGLVSWVSPLARALLGAEVGDVVHWERPDGALELEVTALCALPAD
jgi:transcription elongation GreA/GreB family factor